MILSTTNNRWIYFLIVASGVLMSTMDSSMMNVALPAIMRHFDLGMQDVKLVVLVYLMVITFSLVFWGRVADQFGKGRVFFSGMTLFITAAAACSLAGQFWILLVTRFVQAIGAAMMMSAGPAILKFTSPRGQLGKTLGMVGIATSLGLMSGPIVSGMLLEYFSWRAIFLVSAPLGLIILLFGKKCLMHDLQQLEQTSKSPFDWRGSTIWMVLVASYVLFVSGGLDDNLLLAGVIFLFLVSGLIFIRVESKAMAPILPMVLLRNRYYWSGVSTAAVSFAALFIVLILMPFHLEYVKGVGSAKVGLTMMALPVSLVVMSPLSGWLYDRLGSARVISTAGLALSSIAIIQLLRLQPDSSMTSICINLATLGAGQSIFLSPNSASVLTRVEDEYAGITSGILATARNFGMLTGAAVAGTSFSFLFSRYTGGLTLQSFEPIYLEPFMRAQQLTLSLALLLLLIGCTISALRG